MLARASQALADHLHHVYRKVRHLFDQAEEPLLIDHREAAVGCRDSRGAAESLVDERHFTEYSDRQDALDGDAS